MWEVTYRIINIIKRHQYDRDYADSSITHGGHPSIWKKMLYIQGQIQRPWKGAGGNKIFA